MKKTQIIFGFISGFLLEILQLIRFGCVLYGIFCGVFTIGFLLWNTPENAVKTIIYLFAFVGVHTMTKVIEKMYLEKPYSKLTEFLGGKTIC